MNSILKTACCSLAVVVTITVLTPGCAAQNTTNQIRPAQSSTQTVSKSRPGLMDPSKATLTAPSEFLAVFKTTKGEFTVKVARAWAPNGADRFYNMIKVGYFDDEIAIYRAVEGFMFQFGIHGNPEVNAKWANANIPDDPSVKSNTPDTISFAQTQLPNSRSVQMFVNMGMNTDLDRPQGITGSPFVPFGKVVKGSEVLRKINTEYGENPRGENIQGNFKAQGNPYILDRFKRIDLIKSVTIIEN